MIIGNGLIAKAFSFYKNKEDILIFASGVSNSQNKDKALFLREQLLLEKALFENKNKLFIYFSTCSIYDTSIIDSYYIQHKVEMEKIIKSSGTKFLIIRISNPVGETTNPNTLLNFLHNKIINKQQFTVAKNAKRNLIDVEDLFKITEYIISNNLLTNRIINIANTHNYSIFEIVESIEKAVGNKGMYDIQDTGGEPIIDISGIANIIEKSSVNFNNDYLDKLMNKYY